MMPSYIFYYQNTLVPYRTKVRNIQGEEMTLKGILYADYSGNGGGVRTGHFLSNKADLQKL